MPERQGSPPCPISECRLIGSGENRGLMQDYCQGTAYVIPNKVIRAVLRVIFSLQKQPVPYKIF